MWRALIVSLALICLVLLGWYAIKKYPGRIEADIAARAQTAVAARVPGVKVQASQRDLVLSGRVETEEDRSRAQAFVLEVSGVKSVVNQLEVGAATPTPAPVPEPTPTPAADASADTADTAQPDTQPAPDTALIEAEVADAGPVEADAAAPADVAEVNDAATVETTAADVAAPGGTLTASQCKEAIASAVEGDKRIMFQSNTGKLTDEGQARLAEVWAILQRCPEAKGAIEAYHDDFGDPDKVKTLTQIRAYNTHKRLVDMGMDGKRFRYLGLGYRNMRYRKPGERLLNQRIEFNITVE
jgi:outer membrane protein OmpA-like peptidoglycan-associated protein